MLNYTDITQNTYFQSWTVTEIMAREKCGLLAGLRAVPVSWQRSACLSSTAVLDYRNTADAAAVNCSKLLCIVLGTLKDNYDVSAGFFVV
jgi:hypothetical protein